MTHPMSTILRSDLPRILTKDQGEELFHKIALELDRLHAIEQEARNHYETSDGVLTLDPRTDVWFLDNDPLGRPPHLCPTHFDQREAIGFSGNLSIYYSTREAALAAAKGTT